MTAAPTRSGNGIRNRLVVSMGAMIVASLLMTGVTFAVVAQTISALSSRTETIDALMTTEESLKTAIISQETFAFDYALSHDERPIAELNEARTAEREAYVRLAELAPGDPALMAAATKVRELAAAWESGWLEPFIAAHRAGETVEARKAIDDSEALYAPVEDAISALEVQTSQRRDTLSADVTGATERLAAVLIPVGLVATLFLAVLGAWLTRTISGPLARLSRTAQDLVAGGEVSFAAERDDEIGALAGVLEQLRSDVGERYASARREAVRAATFNQLAELTSFAQDEESLVSAAVKTLSRIAPTTRGHVMLVNNSTNRLIVAAGWGDTTLTPGAPVEIDRIDRCPGIRRATAYVAADLADDMTVRCPVHSAESGTVVCLPMPALGSIVGVIHLERPAPDAFDPDTVQNAARVAEQVALAIANSRLMKTMEGLANTDPLTGLRNPRFFDSYLEQELTAADRDRENVGLIMLDVDHFKVFNDTHGHPAGDEALRTLARSLRSLIRASDVVARYGGEEFVLALHHTTLAETALVAEKIRQAVEQTVVEIGPGRYARMTVSLGIAATDAHKVDRKGLVSLADAALYRAKEGGRNRVEQAPSSDQPARPDRRRRSRAATDPIALRAS